MMSKGNKRSIVTAVAATIVGAALSCARDGATGGGDRYRHQA